VLPEDIRNKPYVKDVKNFSGLVKKLDGAQTLLGQRNVPGADSSSEEWETYLNKLRPAKASDYVMPTVEGIDPEYLKSTVGSPILVDLLHKAGTSPYQANILMTGLANIVDQSEKTEKIRHDQVLSESAKSTFGDQADVVLANGKKFLAANIPEAMQPLLNEMDPKTLTAVLGITDSLAKKFTGEDPYRTGAGVGSGTSKDTKESIVAEMQVIQKDPAYTDAFKDKVKNAQLHSDMEKLRERLRKVVG